METRGYLYAEECQGSVATGTFQRRYFELKPLLGMQWFMKNPNPSSEKGPIDGKHVNVHDIGVQHLEQLHFAHHDANAQRNEHGLFPWSTRTYNMTSGWVFGGNVSILSVQTEPPSLQHLEDADHQNYESAFEVDPYSEGHLLYPFKLSVKCGEYETEVRLAAESEHACSSWVRHIEAFVDMQCYVAACTDCHVAPSLSTYQASLSGIATREIADMSHQALSPATLQGLLRYVHVAAPHGTLLLSLQLKDCQLDDVAASLVKEILGWTRHLTSLSLADNSLSDEGSHEVAAGLFDLQSLRNLDLSGNAIGDAGFATILQALATCPQLTRLNVSRNNLSAASIRPLTSRLASHKSMLTHLNLAYNPLGDGAGALIALLMYNQPSQLQMCDASFCGISDVGVREVAAALAHCSSLQSLLLRGAFVGPTTMVQLTEGLAAQHAQHTRYRRGKVEGGATLHIGGFEADAVQPKALSYTSLRRSTPYLSERALLKQLLLRKRLPSMCAPTAATAIEPGSAAADLDDGTTGVGAADVPYVCMRVQLPAFCASIQEVLERLCDLIGAYYRQVQILSVVADEADPSSRSLYCVFTIGEPTAAMAYQRISGTFNARVAARMTVSAAAALMEAAPSAILRPVSEILQTLRSLASAAHPMFRKLGVRSLFVQALPTEEHPYPTFSCHLAEANMYTDGAITDRHLQGPFVPVPQLSPDAPSPAVAPDTATSTRDLIESTTSTLNLTLRLTRDPTKGHALRPSNTHAEPAAASGQDTATAIAALAEQEAKEREKRLTKGLARREKRAQNESLIIAVRQLKRDGVIDSTIAQFYEGALGNARYKPIALAIMQSAVSEHGVFPVVHACKELFAAMHKRDIQTVASQLMRLQDANSLNKRNSDANASATANGSVTAMPHTKCLYLEHAQRLCSEVLTIQREALTLRGLFVNTGAVDATAGQASKQTPHMLSPAMAQTAETDLAAVEAFLLTCGVTGYSGPEMFAAVEARQALVQQLATEKPEALRAHLLVIQHRALLSNLLISRDFLGLEQAMHKINVEAEPAVLELSEYEAALALLTTRSNIICELEGCTSSLLSSHSSLTDSLGAHSALGGALAETKLRERLLRRDTHAQSRYRHASKIDLYRFLNALAHAAYLGIPLDMDIVSLTYEVLFKYTCDARLLVFPLLQGLRSGNLLAIDAALTTAADMGWRHMLLHPAIPGLIIKKRAQMLSADAARSHIMRLALAVRNEFTVNLSEVFTALRRGRQLGLDDKTELHVYFNTLYQHLQDNAAQLEQEEHLQLMLDKEDITGIEDLLSGRGQVSLVVNAPSAELMKTWIEALSQAAVNSGAKRVSMLGTMEKAARTATGVLRGWRHRYFTLEDGMLSYYTSRDGELKGTVRAAGGQVTRLNPSEAAGREFAFQLQEGLDTSSIDADLLAEAAAMVRRARVGTLRASIAAAMKKNDLNLLTKQLKEATSVSASNMAASHLDPISIAELSLDVAFLHEAQQKCRALELQQMQQDMRQAAVRVHPAELEDVIRRALTAKVDTAHGLLQRLLRLAEQSGIAQAVLRAREAMLRCDTVTYRKALSTISRYEMKQFTMRDGRLVSALLLQNAAKQCVRLHQQGISLTTTVPSLLALALSACRLFMIETEPMQMGRLAMSLAQNHGLGHRHGHATDRNDVLSISALDGYAAAEVERCTPHTGDDLRIERFSLLNTTLAVKAASMFSFRSNSSRSEAVTQMGPAALTELLSFTPLAEPPTNLPMTTTLLESASGGAATGTALALDMFKALQAVLGELPVSKAKGKASGGLLQKRKDVAFIAADLCQAGRVKHTLRDELYLQLCKQIRANPSAISRLRGWLLLSLYLHAFPPSAVLLPHLRHWLSFTSAVEVASAGADASIAQTPQVQLQAQVLADAQYKYELKLFESLTGDHLRATKHSLRETRLACTRLARYCVKVFSNVEAAAKTSDAASNNADISTSYGGLFARAIDRDTAACVLGRANLSLQTVLLTGSIYKHSGRYGDGTLDTPMSLFSSVYKRLVGGPPGLAAVEASEAFRRGSDSASMSATALWDEWLLQQFRGFSFYVLASVGDTADLPGKDIKSAHFNSTGYRMSQLPVQADESLLLPNSIDLQWALLTARVEGIRRGLHQSNNEQIFEFQDTPQVDLKARAAQEQSIRAEVEALAQRPLMDLLLVRRSASASSGLCVKQELFGPHIEVVETDIVRMRQLWEEFLSTVSGDSAAPAPNASAAVSATSDGATVYKELPLDHVRVDLLFADDSRRLNAKLQGPPGDVHTYLLALQLALSWVDDTYGDLAHRWCATDDGVVGGTDCSVRATRRAAYPSPAELEDRAGKERTKSMIRAGRGDDAGVAKTVRGRMSAYFRRSVVNAGDGFSALLRNQQAKRSMRLKSLVPGSAPTLDSGGTTGEPETKGDQSDSDDEDDENAEEKESVADSTEDRYYEQLRRLQEHSSESSDSSEKSDDSSSDDGDHDSDPYLSEQSSSENDSDSESKSRAKSSKPTVDPAAEYKAAQRAKGPILSYAELTPLEKSHLEEHMCVLGVNPAEVDMEDVVDWIAKFHSIALSAGCPIDCPPYRYLLKRAYIALSSALPLYGSFYSESVWWTDEGPREVTMALSPHSLHLLDPLEWSVVFACPLCDVEACKVTDNLNDGDDHESSASDDRNSGGSGKSSRSGRSSRHGDESESDNSEKSKERAEPPSTRSRSKARALQLEPSANSPRGPRLLMNVNGSRLELIGPQAETQYAILFNYVLEALAWGSFPHGTEGGNDLHYAEHIVPLTDPREKLRSYVHDFPLLPVPPSPLMLPDAPDKMDLPKSRRELMAEARIEEELLEQEQARLAAAKIADRLIQQRTRGKKEVQAYGNVERDMDADDGIDDDNANDEEESVEGLDAVQRFSKKHKGKSNGKKQNSSEQEKASLLRAQSHMLSQQFDYEMKISSAVSGVPAPASRRPPRHDPDQPHVGEEAPKVITSPVKRAGKYRIEVKSASQNNLQAGSISKMTKPILRRTAIPDPAVLVLPPAPVSALAPTSATDETAAAMTSGGSKPVSNSARAFDRKQIQSKFAKIGLSVNASNATPGNTGYGRSPTLNTNSANDDDVSAVGYSYFSKSFTGRVQSQLQRSHRSQDEVHNTAGSLANALHLDGQLDSDAYTPLSPRKKY